MTKIKKKGLAEAIYGLMAAAIGIVILAITLGLGGKVTNEAFNNSATNNTSFYAGPAFNTMSSYLPLIGTLVVIVTLLVILIVYLAKKFGNDGM